MVALAARASGLWGRLAGLLCIGMLFSQPITYSVTIGNASVVVAAVLAVAATCWRRAPPLTGMLFGVATLLKLTPVLLVVFLFGAWLAARDRRTLLACTGALLTLALGALLPHTLAYLASVTRAVDSRIAAGANFSVAADMYRLLGVAKLATALFVLACLVAGWLGFRMSNTRKGLVPGFALGQLAVVAFSPVAWSHWFALAVWPAGLALGAALASPNWRRPPRDARSLSHLLFVIAAALTICETDFFYFREPWFGHTVLPLFPLLALSALAGILLSDPRDTFSATSMAHSEWARRRCMPPAGKACNGRGNEKSKTAL